MGGDGVIFALKAPEGEKNLVMFHLFFLLFHILTHFSSFHYFDYLLTKIKSLSNMKYVFILFRIYIAEGNYDFTMRIYNSDGSEPEMCGNGIRCFAQFLKDLGADGTL